ncbi:sensor histidine kinase [Sulfobacillus thermosulfidooxidans]|uniref:sensor histidine kinase n=1 Tax=Sulfobacillus thermosulfidooxidans TaxID=28034 RepID=UPI000979EE73|nr:histidine kinase [Sulfobacillus thermosulfidooxidans]OLZ08098.1 histidine kinase [Sulfobacillus thermosulfidooxidans]OLZ16512.1 histidine kinase [Sulfobacillus thermosulfidooxidans]OLZ19599.1 histidine kinase [Sulfobacillus thermosulfidooxidans]
MNTIKSRCLAILSVPSVAIIILALSGTWAWWQWLVALVGIGVPWTLFFMKSRAKPSALLQDASAATLDAAETTFQIGHAALPHLRQGLNRETAQHIANIIQRTVGVEAVAITDTHIVLGWAGKKCPQHDPGTSLSTTTKEVMRDKVQRILKTEELQGAYDECQLGVVVITPLISHNQAVGSVKLYVAEQSMLPKRVGRLAEGIAQLLSILLEVAEVDRQRSLAAAARLEALQAQIRPHFLFNVLNTIISFSRTDPDKARDLLIQLASFFRRSLSHKGSTVLLKDEIDYVQTYLNLEKARYGDKLRYRLRIQPESLQRSVPVLIIQPLVENAVIHGIAEKEGSGMVSVSIRNHGSDTIIYISDNGRGIAKSKQREIFQMGQGQGMGLGLSNVSERLVGLYGSKYRLRLRSSENKGTTVRLVIPATGPRQDAAQSQVVYTAFSQS